MSDELLTAGSDEWRDQRPTRYRVGLVSMDSFIEDISQLSEPDRELIFSGGGFAVRSQLWNDDWTERTIIAVTSD